ncbi:hypothetical protein EJB05_44297 [Eragrostis curvula]|uniref:Uncharacterized protein n=1 Tax=Eragrostis curvula TaxID=38414 RepID=A0A5J9TJA5_9POAL|nr:hypothetical protein EJB05_44297 [Eragrostis curvula]
MAMLAAGDDQGRTKAAGKTTESMKKSRKDAKLMMKTDWFMLRCLRSWIETGDSKSQPMLIATCTHASLLEAYCKDFFFPWR